MTKSIFYFSKHFQVEPEKKIKRKFLQTKKVEKSLVFFDNLHFKRTIPFSSRHFDLWHDFLPSLSRLRVNTIKQKCSILNLLVFLINLHKS
jgi:hypothetical protein